MLDKDIKVNVVGVKKKVPSIQLKPRTVSSQVGVDDEGRIHNPTIAPPPPFILTIGAFSFAIPPEDEVNPNFRTPPS
jgi:hypothetical protein